MGHKSKHWKSPGGVFKANIQIRWNEGKSWDKYLCVETHFIDFLERELRVKWDERATGSVMLHIFAFNTNHAFILQIIGRVYTAK